MLLVRANTVDAFGVGFALTGDGSSGDLIFAGISHGDRHCPGWQDDADIVAPAHQDMPAIGVLLDERDQIAAVVQRGSAAGGGGAHSAASRSVSILALRRAIRLACVSFQLRS